MRLKMGSQRSRSLNKNYLTWAEKSVRDDKYPQGRGC